MRTDFSEFSYGYALVEELVKHSSPNLTVAPIFPSLIQEGADGGGYDVKLDRPGVPLLIQFKRPDVMMTANSKEISQHGLALNTPFYRFHIRSSGRSRQHDMLLEHDHAGKEVYYAAPCFHEIHDFNRTYASNEVVLNSVFIRPRDIGPLSAEPHHVAYDNIHSGWCFSEEPHEVEKVTKGIELRANLDEAIEKETRDLNQGVIDALVEDMITSLKKHSLVSPDSLETLRSLSDAEKLKEMSRKSQIYLQSQLFILQSS